MIRARGLGKRFGARVAIQALDLTAAKGEVIGLLGPNGAGKTTTVRMLAGLIPPSEGEAEVCGLSVGRDGDEIRARVGLLTETPGLYDHLSPLENLVYFGELYGVSAAQGRTRATRLLERFALGDRMNDLVGGFSKGMRQKVALARALLHEPDVLFLDEPTSGLDPEAARSVRELIADQAAHGRTILLCTHNLDEVARLCQRVFVISGKLLGSADLEARPPTAILLDGPAEGFLEVVRKVAGVSEAWAQGEQLLARVGDDRRDHPVLVAALCTAGARILEVRHAPRQIEELYFRLLGTAPHNGELTS